MDADPITLAAAQTALIALRLADEGVPLRAIARATAISSTELYSTLVEAKMRADFSACRVMTGRRVVRVISAPCSCRGWRRRTMTP